MKTGSPMPLKSAISVTGIFFGIFLMMVAVACTDDSSSTPVEVSDASLEKITSKNFEIVDMDTKKHSIEVSPETECGSDSCTFVFKDIFISGKATVYLTADSDSLDPEIDWENPVEPGLEVPFGMGMSFSFALLDEKNRVAEVWFVCWPEDESESSSSAKEESSSSAKADSSEGDKGVSSSDTAVESSSSNSADSTAKEVATDSTAKEEPADSVSKEEPADSTAKENPADSTAEEAAQDSVQYLQLPGSDFTAMDTSVWASTGVAMATGATGSYEYCATEILVCISKKTEDVSITATDNAVFEDGALTLVTGKVSGSGSEFGTVEKVAGGFYFTGSFTGKDAQSIYNAEGSEYESSEVSDFSKMFTYGTGFTEKPKAFKIKYSYKHVASANESYAQRNLIYVMLVSEDNKVVASGMISDTLSVDMDERTVDLEYGQDSQGLLDSGYPVASELSLGDGSEAVAKIHVMFASSAYGFVADVDGRGGVGSELTVDNFELVY